MYPVPAQFCHVTAGKHLSVLFIKTSGGQWQRTAGGQQHLYHSCCFCSEHLPTADAFQPYQAKMTEIHIHSGLKMHALQSGGHVYCHVLHVLQLRKYEWQYMQWAT